MQSNDPGSQLIEEVKEQDGGFQSFYLSPGNGLTFKGSSIWFHALCLDICSFFPMHLSQTSIGFPAVPFKLKPDFPAPSSAWTLFRRQACLGTL